MKWTSIMSLIAVLYFNVNAQAQSPAPPQLACNNPTSAAAPVLTKWPASITVERDIAYGDNPCQRYDVYRPTSPAQQRRPIIVMVHGGAWAFGDKDNDNVVLNKVTRWVPKGFVFVSINYRLGETIRPAQQATDVLDAIDHIRGHAADYDGAPSLVIVMGHSAGGHLALLASSAAHPQWTDNPNRIVAPWLGTISIDTAAYNVPYTMTHLENLPFNAQFYVNAFGKARGYWRRTSPLHQLGRNGPSILAVCSKTRPDEPCDQALRYKDRGPQYDRTIKVMSVPQGHAWLNRELGQDKAYTTKVEAFMRSLDPRVAASLKD